MKRTFLYLLALVLCAACSDNDSFTSSRSARLSFSTDTVRMDTVFANVPSSTYTFWVYNHSGDGVRLSSVRLKGGNQTGFRVNVDGSYLDNSLGSVATDLELRRGDSLRVFVELTAPETGRLEAQAVEDDLLFALESGVEQRVALRAYAWDAVRVEDLVVASDTTIESSAPIVVYGSGLRVDSGATLTLRHTTLYFHDRAGIDVHGTLLADSCLLRGDRLDHMFDYLPYDRVSGQWRGLYFAPTSSGNELTDTEIRNAETGVCLSEPAALDTTARRLVMTRCTVHNAKGHGVVAYNSALSLSYCQLTNTLGDCLAVYGGVCDVDHCTLAQFYPFSADSGMALRFANCQQDTPCPLLRLDCRNSILTGYADDVLGGTRDTTQAFEYHFADCLIRTPMDTLDNRMERILWETPKDSVQGKRHFRLIDEENLRYDFHLDSLSTATAYGCYPLYRPRTR